MVDAPRAATPIQSAWRSFRTRRRLCTGEANERRVVVDGAWIAARDNGPVVRDVMERGAVLRLPVGMGDEAVGLTLDCSAPSASSAST